MQLIQQAQFSSTRRIKLMQGDLTQAKVDVIVNAANSHLAHGGGVAGAIVERGGELIQRQSNAWVAKHGPITQEAPAITDAGRLPCRYVIHAVGPVWGEGDEDRKLHAAVFHALALAEKRGLQSLALPALSTGIFRFPLQRAAKLILQAIVDYVGQHPQGSLEEIWLVLFDDDTAGVFEQALKRMDMHTRAEND